MHLNAHEKFWTRQQWRGTADKKARTQVCCSSNCNWIVSYLRFVTFRAFVFSPKCLFQVKLFVNNCKMSAQPGVVVLCFLFFFSPSIDIPPSRLHQSLWHLTSSCVGCDSQQVECVNRVRCCYSIYSLIHLFSCITVFWNSPPSTLLTPSPIHTRSLYLTLLMWHLSVIRPFHILIGNDIP